MKLVKSIVALMLIAACLFSLASCTTTKWVVKDEGDSVSDELYIAYLVVAYLNADQQASYDGDTTTPMLQKKIEDKPASQWIKDTALDMVMSHISLARVFDDMKLSFTDEEKAEIEKNVTEQWDSQVKSILEPNGSSKEAFLELTYNGEKQQKVFEALYLEGGSKAPTADEIKTYYDEHWINFNMMMDTLKDKDGNADTDEAKAGKIDKFKALLARIDAGETFAKISAEFQNEKAKENVAEGAEAPTEVKEEDITPQFSNIEQLGYPEELMTELKKIEKGKTSFAEITIQETPYIFLLQNLSIEEKFEETKDSIINAMKGEEFTKYLDDIAAEVNKTAKINSAAFNRFTPEKIIPPSGA